MSENPNKIYFCFSILFLFISILCIFHFWKVFVTEDARTFGWFFILVQIVSFPCRIWPFSPSFYSLPVWFVIRLNFLHSLFIFSLNFSSLFPWFSIVSHGCLPWSFVRKDGLVSRTTLEKSEKSVSMTIALIFVLIETFQSSDILSW